MKNTDLQKPRKIWKALLFSLLSLGVGQIYNGQIRKLLFFLIFIIFIPIIFAATKITTTFYGNVIYFFIFFGFVAFVIVDACIWAKKQKYYVSKWYNRWFFHLIFGVILFLVFWLNFESPFSIKNNYVRYFKIPTTSSEPTVQMGDFLVTDMQAYKKTAPDYGDMAVFTVDNQFFIFRVVGKPNDTLSINNDFLTINNKQLNTLFIKKNNFSYKRPVNEYEETLPNGRKYFIYKDSENSYTKNSNIENIIVPENCYFLMGDNRDNACDSRYIGVVTREQIKGKATCVLYGNFFKRINIDLTKN